MEFIEQDRKMMMLLDVFDDFGHMDRNNDTMLDFQEFKIPFTKMSDESVVASVFQKFDQVFKRIVRAYYIIAN